MKCASCANREIAHPQKGLCHPCYMVQYYMLNPEKKDKHKEMCRKYQGSEDGKRLQRRWRNANPPGERDYCKEWREKNKEYVKEYRRKRYLQKKEEKKHGA